VRATSSHYCTLQTKANRAFLALAIFLSFLFLFFSLEIALKMFISNIGEFLMKVVRTAPMGANASVGAIAPVGAI